ncbi:hypothetical protein HWV62_29642 [Athelia sp. TMB]|nr:hypothetical protein HWV62_29642 [Athelia sp. TMB]
MHVPLVLSALGAVASPLQMTKRTTVTTDLYNDLVYYFQYASSAYSESCANPNGNTLVEEFTDGATYTQGFIARDDTRQEIVVALRGSSSAGDFLTDAELLLDDYTSPGVTPPANVSAHSGFLNAWNSVAPGIISQVTTQLTSYPGYAIVTSGHSLGGSLSSLAAMSMKANFPNNAVRMYTYGQPRTGNDAYAYWVNDQFGDQAFRSTHTDDGSANQYLDRGVEYWQNPDPASAATTVVCAADGEDPTCSASIPSEGIDVAHTIVPLHAEAGYLTVTSASRKCHGGRDELRDFNISTLWEVKSETIQQTQDTKNQHTIENDMKDRASQARPKGVIA